MYHRIRPWARMDKTYHIEMMSRWSLLRVGDVVRNRYWMWFLDFPSSLLTLHTDRYRTVNVHMTRSRAGQDWWKFIIWSKGVFYALWWPLLLPSKALNLDLIEALDLFSERSTVGDVKRSTWLLNHQKTVIPPVFSPICWLLFESITWRSFVSSYFLCALWNELKLLGNIHIQ
jgi:hypothetical protein